jgi:FkbM family methyltransferase
MGRPHESDYLALRHFVRDQPSVVDVGANRGQAILSLRRVLKGPIIWSFEPNKDLAKYLDHRFASEGVIVHPYGLGSSNETMPLYMPKYGHTVWDTRASIEESEARRHLSADTFWRFAPERASVVRVDVDIRILDEFQLTPDILKIDVEGAESEVVRGGMDTIKSNLPVILVEGTGTEVEELIGSLGYRRYQYDVNEVALVRDRSGSLNTFLLCPNHLSMFKGIALT